MKIASLLFGFWFQIKAFCNGWNIALFILAFIPRLLWAFDHHPPPFSDMEDYYLCAVNALRGEFLAMEADRLAYRAPGYPLFLYSVFTGFPADRLLAVRIIQSILGALTVVLLYSIAKQVMKPLHILRSQKNALFLNLLAFLTAWHYGWMRDSIFFSSVLMTETLYTFLVLLWIRLIYSNGIFSSLFRCSILSMMLGILALIRPVSLIFLPVLVFQVLLHSSKSTWKKHAFIPLLAWLIPILPWTIRNFIMLGSFVLISTNSGVNFYIGHQHNYSYYNTGEKENIRVDLIAELGYIDEVAEDRLFFQKGLEELTEYPHLLIQHSLQKLYYLYIEDRQPWPWFEYNQRLGTVDSTYISYLPFDHLPQVQLHWNPILFLFTLAGITYSFIKKLPHRVLLSILGLYTLACLLYFARTRFRLPIEPLLILYGWLGIVSILETVYSVFWYWCNRMADPKDIEQKSFKQVTLRR